jgi:formiminotetrahydrofolate cyclodeaminase
VAAQVGALGTGLLEMAAAITARNPSTAPEVTLRLVAAGVELAELRTAMLQLAQDDVHRYCALLSAVYDAAGAQRHAKLARWTFKCAVCKLSALQFCPSSGRAPRKLKVVLETKV